jgi:hypothetical protein
VSALRSPSERIFNPPASSICIIRDVPERGNPETIVIIIAFQEAKIAAAHPLLGPVKIENLA